MAGYCCRCGPSGGGTSCGGERQGPGGEWLAPLQQLLLLLQAEARWHLSGRVALLERSLRGGERLASAEGALAIATAWGCGRGDAGVGGGQRRDGVELGRVWHLKQERKNRNSGVKVSTNMLATPHNGRG